MFNLKSRDGPPDPGATRARRRFLVVSGLLAAAPLSVVSRLARASAPDTRRLAFEHTHTGERLSVAYAYGHAYDPAALSALQWLLRDFRSGATHPIDPALFDQLHTLSSITGSRKPFQIISGYRSPATNANLRENSTGVASHSLHLLGQAIDVRLADVPLADLRDAAVSLKAGGVGFYPGSDFVHVDTG
ncbi:MAG: DUF882 domain-containing protein, partial [Casimicrobiaceae bacterium]